MSIDTQIKDMVIEIVEEERKQRLYTLDTYNYGIMFPSGLFMDMESFENMCKDYLKRNKPEDFV